MTGAMIIIRIHFVGSFSSHNRYCSTPLRYIINPTHVSLQGFPLEGNPEAVHELTQPSSLLCLLNVIPPYYKISILPSSLYCCGIIHDTLRRSWSRSARFCLKWQTTADTKRKKSPNKPSSRRKPSGAL
ncbi:hypothetical protein JAAARDRAFT_681097 [Jaapia argillacea MUCL 33604]|uniref:Uncharacterized protein n=1 Tax=Jaapia argillacea MUCL 33604 TaxID=933084 RepID=A0A067PF88_9AGAM|nr:hypothetical protein JAAARDRAFT_681097 [Jaapia argillacea MUCL 33604]